MGKKECNLIARLPFAYIKLLLFASPCFLKLVSISGIFCVSLFCNSVLYYRCGKTETQRQSRTEIEITL